jgi:predicted outer membrane repeat protein
VTNSGFTNNSAGNFGGAIFNLTENLVVTNTSFDENPVASTGQGGAIFTNSSIDIEHDRFDSNNAGSGGAIGAIAGPLVVNSSTFSNNAATADGGAIKVAQAATIMTSTFIGNSAGTNGGAIALSGGAASDSFNVSKDNFFGNSATVVGGAIFDNAAAAPVLIDNDGFSSFIGGVPGNSAGLGGAIATQTGSTTTVSNSTFTDNGSLTSSPGVVATLAGGALFSPAGALVLTADTFRANKVTASGGGVYLSSPATVTRSTFTGNMAVNGGAILSDVAQVTVSNNTISANSARLGGGIFVAGGALGSTDDTLTLNTAAEAGGAVYNGNTGTATLNFDTLSNDSTASVAALQNAGAGTLTVSDSILNETLSCSGTITDGGYNAESDNSCGFGATDVVSSPNLHVAAALDANGSSGPQTLAIDSSSSASSLVPLARCTGVNNNTDERGFARPDPAGGPCDAGAFEVAGAPPAATITGTPPAATIGKPYSFTFTTTGSTGCTLTAPLPAGLSFNAATCTISGTPATSGSFPISVVANGNGGNSAPDVATLISHRPISRAAVVAASTNWSLGDALPGTTTNNFSYGTKPLSPLMGDWNGDGIRTVGTFELGTFKLRNSNTAGAPDVTFTFGDPRGFPVAGDFDGNGYTDVAVYRAGHWQIHYLGPGAPADQSFSLGAPFATGTYPNTVPVAGDWNGDGIDGIGTYNLANGTWTLKNTVGAGAPDIAPFVFWGGVGSYPVVGDWTGIGIDTPGYRQGSVWTVRTTAVTEGPTSTFNFGVTNSVPFAWSAP